jgi:SAM-dependent methyltransferase
MAKKVHRVKAKSKKFWNKEYRHGAHLTLSTTPSEDMIKFTRWLERQEGRKTLNPIASMLDIGCGNGRNLVYLSNNYGMRGFGFDISASAIESARKLSEDLPLTYEVRSMADPLPLPDASQTIVLDMMVSHFLDAEKRGQLVAEIARVLRPGGWFFFKTFLLDEDRNAERLLRTSPGEEEGTYVHPEIGVPEHVATEQEIEASLAPYFAIHKMVKSHGHLSKGKAHKRRSISVYAQRV